MEEISWRIDSLDARAGLAFASQRPEGFDPTAPSDATPLCVFVGAPDFQPEAVANRAVALSAGRGLFQTGLFIGEAEVEFPSLADVVEFVRRSYLRGGGGDGSDGPGGDLPPPPDEGPDLPEPEPDMVAKKEGRSLAGACRDSLLEFRKTSEALHLGDTRAFEGWPSPISSSGASGPYADGPRMLASAAASLIIEMLRRLPLNGTIAQLSHWNRSAMSLGSIINDLRLWPYLLTESHLPDWAHIFDQLRSSGVRPPIFYGSPEELPTGISLVALFCHDAVLYDTEMVDNYFDAYNWYVWRVYPTSGTVWKDPVATLEHIPVPQRHMDFCGRDDWTDHPSLHNLVTAFLGAPDAPGGMDDQLLGLVLVGASAIVSSDLQTPIHLYGRLHWGHISDAYDSLIQQRADASWNWIREHLPGVVFPQPLESVITSTADFRYRASTFADT